MSNRDNEKRGLDRELAAKNSAKYDHALEEQARDFIATKTGVVIPAGPDMVAEALKSGVVLCQLINTLRPGSVAKINTNKMPFMMMENIGKYLEACERYGVRRAELFQTVDLYEKQNMTAVITNILAVARVAGAGVAPTSTATNAYVAAERAYVEPPTVKSKTSGVVPLLQAGAAAAGMAATKGAFGTGRRDIVYGDAGSNEVPLLQKRAGEVGEAATAGAFTPDSRSNIVRIQPPS
eukprot:c38933_g1_i1.p1 GENE.c38933_g1_i1~~c38933_g1_i1.p1  ORF type:complete len:247 (-),score=46.76 c38933_g1_i1:50-760(-)